jgi:hypothetical protein
MRVVIAGVLALSLLGVSMVWHAVSTMCQEEIRTRLSRIPDMLLRLAAFRVLRDVRRDLYEEWAAELDFMVSETEGLPITRLWLGLTFAGGMLRAAPAIARGFTGRPRWTTKSVVQRAWIGGLAFGALSSSFKAAQLLGEPHHLAAGLLVVASGLGILASAVAVLGFYRKPRLCVILYGIGSALSGCGGFVVGTPWLAVAAISMSVVFTATFLRWPSALGAP